jgi:hypothetical protein
MTLEQIDIAIAEHLGWSDIRVGEGARIWGNRPNSAGQDYRKAAVPQFHANLDWMHHAETVLIWDQRGQYRNLLFMNPECEAPVFATAAQKAEAFLRTIGKWQEPDKLSTHIAV